MREDTKIIWKIECSNWKILELLNKEINYKSKLLNKFSWQSIQYDWKQVWCIMLKIHRYTNNSYIYIDKVEIDKEYRWLWLMKTILKLIFTISQIDIIELTSIDESVQFWFRMWAKDEWKSAMLGDRWMSISKTDFEDITSWKKQPYKINTYYDKPYDQTKEKLEDNSHLYKCVWEDNRLPLGIKLYKISNLDEIKERERFTIWDIKNVFSLINNWNEYITVRDDLRVTRYSNIKYENWYSDYSFDSNNVVDIKENFAKENFDAMVNWDYIMIYKF